MKNLYNEANKNEIVNRLESLTIIYDNSGRNKIFQRANFAL